MYIYISSVPNGRWIGVSEGRKIKTLFCPCHWAVVVFCFVVVVVVVVVVMIQTINPLNVVHKIKIKELSNTKS
jgi:hypothetical protein